MIYLYERGVLMIFLDYCDDLKPILITAKNIVNLIKFGIPIILILSRVVLCIIYTAYFFRSNCTAIIHEIHPAAAAV